MTNRTDIAHRYFSGFEASDHTAILELLTDDVVWEIHGHRRLRGKGAFDSEIENEGFEGSPTLTIDRVLEIGDDVVVPHTGRTTMADGTPFAFAAVDILTFDGDLIGRVESWVVTVDG